MTARSTTLVAPLLVVLSACGGDVRVQPNDDDDSAGGSTSVAPPVGGQPSTTTGGGGSDSTGGGGSEPDSDAETLVKEHCPEVAAESHFCVTIGYPNTVYALGADSGDTCYLGEIDPLQDADISSLGVLGSSVYGCSYGAGAFRAPLLGGSLDPVPVDCRAITDFQGGLLMADAFEPDLLFHYADFESMSNGAPLAVYTVDPQFSRMTAHNGTLFTAWHSTDTVHVEGLAMSMQYPSLLLQGFDDWVDGMSITTDERLYLLSSETLFAFDISGGAQLAQTAIATSTTTLSGLYCWSN